MSTLTIVLLVVFLVLVAVFVALYFYTKKMEKQQDEQRAQMEAMAQVISMLIIDKKHVKLKQAGLPQQVMDNTPKYLRWSKVYVVKAKVGPKVMTFMCDDKVFPLVPVKKEVKAIVSGIYITAVKGIRGSLDVPEEKKGFFARFKKNK